jgi:hypothetical protein
MKTDELIAALARDAEPAPRRAVDKRLAAAGLGALVLAVAVVLSAFGSRADLEGLPLALLLKAAVVLVVLAPSAWLASRLARPATRLGRALAPALAIILLPLAALFVLGATPAEAWSAALFPTGFPPCLWSIPIVAAPGAVLIFWAVRSLAPTRLAPAGAAAGALAGGLGALAYCLHCPIDSPAYALAWYPAGVGICAGIGALLGPKVLRW